MLEKIFDIFQVNTVYHAAAYKHVTLVEENICEGVKNNVFSTLAIAKASIAKKVSTLVLVSSDKAVRPTNVMGASKRLSELCLKGIYKYTKNISTDFSIVRFGNVIESSGSVIPKFKKQIKEGGPVTLSHKDVTRYFMTVMEAAQLVIQAGALGKKSEVFVLDMGKSVKINDIIEKMVKLSGLSIKNDKNPFGDIAIEITGLYPGEKLYEELLIEGNPEKTNHPKIQKINDPFIPFDRLEDDLVQLKSLLDRDMAIDVKIFLTKLLELYNSNGEIVDHIYVEKLSRNKNIQNETVIKNKSDKIIKIR
jgi:FlaA1/EpsC-like NDP-sugar epimerase